MPLCIFKRYFARGYMTHRVYNKRETGRLDVDFLTRIVLMMMMIFWIMTPKKKQKTIDCKLRS